MKAKQISFQSAQQQFCNWIRTPESELPQGLPAKHMQIYRNLLFNNICSFINIVYPVAHAMLPEHIWDQLLEEFFQKGKCQSPLYNDIPLQFREYLVDQNHPVLQEYPWLAELLQFEWLELYLDTIEIENRTYTQTGDWQLKYKVWVLVYQYPIYRWTATVTPTQVELMPSIIMVWRNDHDEVCIEGISLLSALLIEQLNQKELIEQSIYPLIDLIFNDLSQEQIQAQIHELKERLIQLQLLNTYH